jgi:hypothetical protein
MEKKDVDVNQLLENLAFLDAADTGRQGTRHGSRVARVIPGSWQADIIRESASVETVFNPSELKAAMGKQDIAIIFLPQTAMITAPLIDEICATSPFDKTIIWETDDTV